MTVAILVPVLWRPGQVAPLLANVTQATPEPHRLLFIADEDDTDELAALAAAGADYIIPGPRTYARKINAGYEQTDEPYLFLAADDLVFHPGWLTTALAYMTDGIGVVGTNDGGCNPRVAKGIHSVHSLVARDYIETQGGTADGKGAVLHSGYRHAFCDDELVGVARKRGVYAHAHDSVVEHMHPYAGKAESDAVYRKGQAAIRFDQRVHRQRRRLWVT